jgi:hypothetical protein
VTDSTRRRAAAFLEEVTITRVSDPQLGLAAGLRLGADVLYYVTDGDAPSNALLLDVARRGNVRPSGRTRINTVAFVSPTDTDVEFLTTLRAMAAVSGGTSRIVDEDLLE